MYTINAGPCISELALAGSMPVVSNLPEQFHYSTSTFRHSNVKDLVPCFDLKIPLPPADTPGPFFRCGVLCHARAVI